MINIRIFCFNLVSVRFEKILLDEEHFQTVTEKEGAFAEFDQS